jgi:hypothetical protein
MSCHDESNANSYIQRRSHSNIIRITPQQLLETRLKIASVLTRVNKSVSSLGQAWKYQIRFWRLKIAAGRSLGRLKKLQICRIRPVIKIAVCWRHTGGGCRPTAGKKDWSMVKLNKIGECCSMLTNEAPTRTRTTKQKLDPRGALQARRRVKSRESRFLWSYKEKSLPTNCDTHLTRGLHKSSCVISVFSALLLLRPTFFYLIGSPFLFSHVGLLLSHHFGFLANVLTFCRPNKSKEELETNIRKARITLPKSRIINALSLNRG